mgnify:CR=1 FL=1
MEGKRIAVVRHDGKFEAILEDMATQKVICREEGQTMCEAIGILVALHGHNFALYEVVCISPIK